MDNPPSIFSVNDSFENLQISSKAARQNLIQVNIGIVY